MRIAVLSSSRWIALLVAWVVGPVLRAAPAADAAPYHVGVARADITPAYPVRLSGYLNRREPAAGVGQRIWAKALALASNPAEPFLLLTVDNCGVPRALRNEVLRRLADRGLASERFALSFTHTHSAPMLTGALVNIFGEDVPAGHQAAVDRYTRELTDTLERIGRAALDDLKPAQLEWGTGKARFAWNRRVPNGPVDHDLPLLVARAPDGKIRALLTSYAAHSTALSGNYNEVHGDWAGSAQLALEADHPGATALVAIGCGGECTPAGARTAAEPERLRMTDELGRTVADEVRRLLAGGLTPLRGVLAARAKETELPFEPLPTRAQWEQQAKQTGPGVAYHAQKNLARLARGEALPTHVPYLVVNWSFGRELAMVFLPGEVVQDYSLRLKEEFDSDRLWVNAYTNDAPCYIPSRRVLALRSYEGFTAMRYYDQPAAFAPAVEELIVAAVHAVVPREFLAGTRTNPLPRPTTPEEAVSLLRTKPDLTVELAAAEPLVIDPVAIDFDPAGRMWVVEMRDYPMGSDGNWKPGGVIKVLTDRDGDGRYDHATVFLEGIPFPTGVMPWRKGAFVCAAPDLLWAEDTDGDGRADVVKPYLTGFVTDNYQARLNSPSLGLDGWIHVANGLRGGVIHRPEDPGRKLDIRGNDFRFRPDTGEFEAVSGRTQFGRVHDDAGNWFGCTAGVLAQHYPIDERYLRRNPHTPVAAGAVNVAPSGTHSQLFPLSRPLERFNQPGHLNLATSACGLAIYRDDALGAAYQGDGFASEPVHSVVTRMEYEPRGGTFAGRRAADEADREFLASSSAWFTPVNARTGPDGALWVVDMARPVIEHPRWIPPERLAKLNPRAGDTLGRIYRVVKKGAKPRPVRDLTRLGVPELVAAFDTPNGTTRDLVQLELMWRGAREAAEPLAALARQSRSPAVRVQALAALDALGGLAVEHVLAALGDEAPAVRRQALELSERFLARGPSPLDAAMVRLARETDGMVRKQLALTLGEWHDTVTAAVMLGEMAAAGWSAPELRAAVLSSAARQPLEILRAVVAGPGGGLEKGQLAGGLAATAVAVRTPLDEILPVVAPRFGEPVATWQLVALAGLQDALERRKVDLAKHESLAPAVAGSLREIRRAYQFAAAAARDTNASASERQAAIRLLGRGFNRVDDHLPVLVSFFDGAQDPALVRAAADVVRASTSPRVPAELLAKWAQFPPAIRPAVIDILTSRDAWAEEFLRAVEQGTVQPRLVPAAGRQRLLKHRDAGVQARARAAFATEGSASRQAVVAQYRPAAQKAGDAGRGAEIFKNTCGVCHVFVGQSVGPPVNTFRHMKPEDILVAVLDPNAAIEPKYAGYTVALKDGRTLAGVIAEESAGSFTLMQPGNLAQNVLRSDVATLTALDASFMPEGLEGALTIDAMADLIAYIASAQPTVGAAEP